MSDLINIKPHLYINSKGYYVTRHSYSGSETFNYCPRKYYLQRVQGWGERVERSSKFFGIALEAGWTFWHRHRQDTAGAVAEFVRLWAEHKDKKYNYNKTDVSWEVLNLDGQELLKLYALSYPDMPFTLGSEEFQVETNFEVFPDTKLRGIEFTSFIDALGTLKGNGRPIIIDCKTSGKEIPDSIGLDPQLRSYAWVKHLPDVGFLWFRKMGRTISKGDPVTILEPYAGLAPGTEAVVLAKDDFGIWVALDPKLGEAMDAQFIGKSKAVEAERLKFIEANSKHVAEKALTKQRLYFNNAVVPEEDAAEIGRAIQRDIVDIVAATKNDDFPKLGGIRFPNDRCTICEMRGICDRRPDLRDMMLERRQTDELDLGKDAE